VQEGTRVMAITDDKNTPIISEDAVRGGVTGHNVRYVLEYGLAGVVAAFVGLALYYGYDRLQDRLSTVLSAANLRAFAPYAAVVIVGAIGARLLLEAWTHLSGRSEDGSQRFMRARVVTQFAIICVLLVISYLAMT
jgi:cytochrome b subunit of formate dehydrogenase